MCCSNSWSTGQSTCCSSSYRCACCAVDRFFLSAMLSLLRVRALDVSLGGARLAKTGRLTSSPSRKRTAPSRNKCASCPALGFERTSRAVRDPGMHCSWPLSDRLPSTPPRLHPFPRPLPAALRRRCGCGTSTAQTARILRSDTLALLPGGRRPRACLQR